MSEKTLSLPFRVGSIYIKKKVFDPDDLPTSITLVIEW